MFIVVGLGNPGREYVNTRHNIGFMVLDILSDRWDIDMNKSHCHAMLGQGNVFGNRVVLAKPQTFMNNAGVSVRGLVHWYKCENDRLILVYDDADLSPGALRVRDGGSAGTHNGMKSVIYQLGFDDFPRVRIGIGRSNDGRDMVAHVLSAPAGGERDALIEALHDAATAVELIIKGELDKAQARFNVKHDREKSDPSDT